MLAIDFAKAAQGKKGLLDHFHHHGYVNLQDLIALLTEAGLKTVERVQWGRRLTICSCVASVLRVITSIAPEGSSP